MLDPSPDPSPLVQTAVYMAGMLAGYVLLTRPRSGRAPGRPCGVWERRRRSSCTPSSRARASRACQPDVCIPRSDDAPAVHSRMPAHPAPSLVRQLRKAYSDVVAVDGLDLEVRPGECFGLLGPNGAGKTTTIEICEGLTAPDAGEVVVLGRRWGTRRPRAPRAARHLAAGDPVRREAHGRGDGPAVPQLLPRGPDAGRGDRPGPARGEGERPGGPALRRPEAAAGARLRPGGRPGAALPRRAHHRARSAVAPPALGPDRATSSAGGRTILLTTHYMDEAERLCDRVAIVDHGRVIAAGHAARADRLAAAPSTWSSSRSADGAAARRRRARGARRGVGAAAGRTAPGGSRWRSCTGPCPRCWRAAAPGRAARRAPHPLGHAGGRLRVLTGRQLRDE